MHNSPARVESFLFYGSWCEIYCDYLNTNMCTQAHVAALS